MTESPPETPEPPKTPEPSHRPESSPPDARSSGLDPDRAAAAAGRDRSEPQPAPVIDTRPYRWTIGIFGIVLLIGFSVYTFVSHGVGTAGIPAGQRLHYFVAPLATSTLNGEANVHPACDPARPNPRALNVCGRKPLVLGLFVTGSGDCLRQIDTLQKVSRQFSVGRVQFAAVAVQAGRGETEALVRSHHWTIPVAYDSDGAVGSLYGVAICPMVELSDRGGVVADRLIGNHWIAPTALAAKVRSMLSQQ